MSPNECIPLKEALEREAARLRPLRDALGAEAARTVDAVIHRGRRLGDGAPAASVEDAASAFLLAVLADHEAELQRLLARIAWLEDERDYENAMRRAMAPGDPAYALDAPSAGR